MDGRTQLARVHERGFAYPLALVLSLILAPHASEAGILRELTDSLHITSSAPKNKDGTSTFPRQGFACCDLHYDGDWVNDGNYSSLPMIAAGTPIEVLSYGRQRAYVKVDGKPMRLGHEFGRDQESLDDWVHKIVVDEDPKPRFLGYPAYIQQAIREGKVAVGMTREQVIAAVGHPRTDENFSPDTPVWRFWLSKGQEYQVNWSQDGRVASVTGDNVVTNLVLYRAAK